MTDVTEPVDPLHYRRVLGHVPTGVTVVTAATPDGPVGVSMGTFTSVSLDPPLVGLLAAHDSRSWPIIRAAGRFCVNVLASDQEDLARTFARRRTNRFAGLDWRPASFSNAPVLAGVAAWIDCSVESVTPAGDHDFVLGRVHELEVEALRHPLIFFKGGYRTLAS